MTTRGNGRPSVVQRGTLQDNAGRTSDTGQREEPQEEPIEHHRDKLPVLDYLQG